MLEARFYGGAKYQSISADITLNHLLARVYVLSATTTGLEANLPDATDLLPGGIYFEVTNDGTNAIELRDSSGTNLLGTINQDQSATVGLLSGGSQDGTWMVDIRTTNAIQDEGFPRFFYYFGGATDASGADADTREYNHQTDAWTSKTAASTNRSESCGCFVIGSRAYACGGNTAGTATDVEEYDPDTWVVKQDMPDGILAAGHMPATGSDGYGYIIGGVTKDRVDQYDSGGDSWSSQTDAPVNRREAASEVLGDDIHIFYGGSSNIADVNRHDRYDVVGDSWDTRTAGPTPLRGDLDSGSADGLMFAFGGKDTTTVFDDTDEYSPTGDSWSSRTAFPLGVRWGWGIAATTSDTIYVAGGQILVSGSAREGDTYEYDPDTWTAKQDIDEDRALWQNQAVFLQA